ncbi:integral membrane protein GPR180-like [Planococcus citri]|uniref:integral membrane protein GPR180-like n=1 Tax=Planococcus citri TaxID=170843 RepID=UPI0031F72743
MLCINSKMKMTGFFLILFLKILNVKCVHMKGTWKSEDFFMFVVKFGFQKTDLHNPYSSGYIYGNITTDNFKSNRTAMFVVLDNDNFIEYYPYRLFKNRTKACQLMFHKISFGKCVQGEKIDFVSEIPCRKNHLCTNAGNPADFIYGSQFSYQIKDFQQPKFWYASFAACYLNQDTCTWHYSKDRIKIDYDIWFVNGNPNRSSFNPFVYQFSFDKHDTVELFLLFFVIYALLVPVQIYAVTHQSHPVTKLFTASLLMEFFGVSMNLLGAFKFAIDGEGYPRIAVMGDVLDILSRTTFMLLLLLLAKGWAVTRMQLTWHPFVFVIWLIYGMVHILLYIWNKVEIDIVKDIDKYQTWPGWLIILLRIVIIFWFLLELRNTMKYEHNCKKLNFFLHFGASALVWFIYLPIAALISTEISPLWRSKLLLAITYAADCLAYCIMTHLLWPTRSEQYFLLATSIDTGGDELDVFNEAPHVLNDYVPASPTLSDSAQYLKLIDLNHYS